MYLPRYWRLSQCRNTRKHNIQRQWLQFVALSCLFTIPLVSAGHNQYGGFYYPNGTEDGTSFNINDVVVASWYSTLQNARLSVWARSPKYNDQLNNYTTISVPSNGTYSISFLDVVKSKPWPLAAFPVAAHLQVHASPITLQQGFNGINFFIDNKPTQSPTTYAYALGAKGTTASYSVPPYTYMTPSPLSTASPPSTQSSTPQPADTNSSAGLSTSAKAGIGVGVAIAALIVLGVAAGIYSMHRRRQRKRNLELEAGKKEGGGDSSDEGSPAPPELPTHLPLTPVEMPQDHERVEMEAGKDGVLPPQEVHGVQAKMEAPTLPASPPESPEPVGAEGVVSPSSPEGPQGLAGLVSPTGLISPSSPVRPRASEPVSERVSERVSQDL